MRGGREPLRLAPRRSCMRACPHHRAQCRPCPLPAELRPSDTLLDLYCGTGSIGLSLAGACAQVGGWHASPLAKRL